MLSPLGITTRNLAALAGLALVLGALLAPPVVPESLAQAEGDEVWAPLTILYTSDVKGHIDPCG
jgi:2',3'-cyclic-nucleotide 2'-phosphodiesterase (5'-nucleotidase family)